MVLLLFELPLEEQKLKKGMNILTLNRLDG